MTRTYGRVFGAAAILLFAATARSASAATNPWPPDALYHYDVVASGGSVVGHSDVLVTSDPAAVAVSEQLQQAPITATAKAQYSTPGLALASYSADFTTPRGAQHMALAIKPGVLTASVPGQSVDIKADPSAPLMIVGDNLVGTLAMTPAILNAAGATSFTLAALQGGKPVVAKVTAANDQARPTGVPEGDRSITVSVAGLDEIFWFDPVSFVVDDVHVPDADLDVRLTSREAATQLPAAAPAPSPVPTPAPHFTSRDVTFASADGVKLAGTLTVPDGVSARMPGIIFVHGSGPEDRNETIGPNPVFLQLSNALSNAGYIVLRYDKRGIGASGGAADSPRSALIADVAAAFDFLRAQPEVDARHVFILGHSEGGELVPSVAADHPSVAGIILMAPPAVPLWQVSMQQATEGVQPANLRAAKAQELAALDSIRNGSNHASGMIWYRSSMDVDPVVDIKRVKSPILILQGGSDVQVLAADLPRLTAAAKSANRDVTWHVFPGDNHLFMSVTPGEPLNPISALHQYLTVPAWIDQNVLQTMIAWLNARSAKT